MGIGSKIFNVFVESGDATPAVQPSTAKVTQPVQTVTAAPVAAAPAVVAGAINPDMLNDIMTAITGADLQGYDYLELMEALKNMAALPFTDEQKIMAAFAAVANQTSRDKILSSIDHYIGVIDTCEKNFLDRAAQKEQNQVTGREDQIKALDAEVEATSKQILELTAKINELQTKKGTLSAEKEEKRVKIDSSRLSFKATAQSMRDKILADKAKIERALVVPATTTQGV